MQMKTRKSTKYVHENPKFNGKRNLGVTGYRLWGNLGFQILDIRFYRLGDMD